MIKAEYDTVGDVYSHKIADFIFIEKMKLEVMPNNKMAVFPNWQISSSYAPFLPMPKTHDFPKYLKDSVRNYFPLWTPIDR